MTREISRGRGIIGSRGQTDIVGNFIVELVGRIGCTSMSIVSHVDAVYRILIGGQIRHGRSCCLSSPVGLLGKWFRDVCRGIGSGSGLRVIDGISPHPFFDRDWCRR